ncbi:unnamed protein product [Prorocentrum cordatum]|uniref:Protein kinase domain-containing protein n=1 Tax=Prorocentrum cordatum TaxID=2364126 RepID=A0ABN9UWT7_9DINO|nr:unnamed protein product [Polarella glacialis]
MDAPPGDERAASPYCGRRWSRCDPESGIDRLTLRFADPRKEEGFARTHKVQLSKGMDVAMISLIIVVLLSLAVHRSWDDSQHEAQEASNLSRWQSLIHCVILVWMLLAFGSGRLLAKRNIVSTLVMEVIVVTTVALNMFLFSIVPKHYIARAFGHDDTEAIWDVELGATDCNLILVIDLATTFVHLLMPIRWVVLVPLEVAAVLAYIAPALLLGSPAMNQVPFNVIGILSLVVISAIGKRAVERQERLMFAGLLSEKQLRFQAEFQLSNSAAAAASGQEVQQRCGSERSSALTRPETTLSAAAFEGGAEHSSLDQIRAIGEGEQWLIASGEVELLTDMVLGSGGFGVVVMGLYYNTLVAVKAPRDNIAHKGVGDSSLPELCNELRILRRIRHPNIAFLYGACMDATLRKLCLVLEFVDGVSLGVFIRGQRSSARPRPAASRSASARSLLIFDILSALRYLHSRQPVVVHGDLKESNILVEERRSRNGRSSYRAKLLDFGLSRILTRRAKPLGGTLRWMAPELLSRQTIPPDADADCYSFGLVTYFIVTSCLPFEGQRAEQVLRQLRRGQPPSLAWPALADELSRACRSVVEQCTQAVPALRPPARQVSVELSAMLSPFVGGAMAAAGEATCAGRSGAGGTSPPPSTSGGPPPSDASAKRALQQLEGVVEARQARGAMDGSSLTSDTSPGSLPPVREDAVMLSGERAGAQVQVAFQEMQVAFQEYRPTPLSTQTLSLALLMSQWNGPMPKGACCWLHGALRALDRVRDDEIGQGPCARQREPNICAQCGDCGLLVVNGRSSCDFCVCPDSSGVVAGASGFDHALAV